MIPLKKNDAVAVLMEHGKTKKQAEAYWALMDFNGYNVVRDGEGLIAVPDYVESLDEEYMTDPKDEGCFFKKNAPEFASQGVLEGKG